MAKILVIDDDAHVRGTLRRVLQLDRHEVLDASNGKEALAILDREGCDLVVTDINMPEMDGIEVIVALAERTPGLPVIAISGGGKVPSDILLSNADLLGAVITLPKPFGLTEMRDAVERALAPRAAGGDSTLLE